MDSAVWGTLPKDLLVRIFARLPLPQLVSLRRSSLEGKWHVNLGDSEFTRLCAKAHTSSCALIFPGASCGYYDVAVVHGVMSFSWLTLKINVGGTYRTGACSFDGGLVCLALTVWSGVHSGSLVIVVANPLTGDCRVLPGHGVQPLRLRMTQLEMDRDTKGYRVILLVRNPMRPWETEAMLFHSGTGVWTHSNNSSSLEHFLGVQHMYVNPINYSGDNNRASTSDPQIIDCRTGEVSSIRDHDRLVFESRRHDYAFVKDRLYLLDPIYDEDKSVRLSISEHQVQVQVDGRCSWPKLQYHHFDHTIELGLNPVAERLHLIACQGFLLVFGQDYGRVVIDENNTRPLFRKIAMLYSLSTGDWLDLQNQRDSHEILKSPFLICDLQWDAVP